MGFTKVVIEGDSMIVINKLCDQRDDLFVIGSIILDIKVKSRLFSSRLFNHAKRSSNDML
ncbi:hypothetical protein PTKIN_Ptkin08bG0145000 [Pterospermum kingtungense]